ncbi:MAG TPA: ABC transporter permease [Dehalococcoidia bacterium]
MERTTELNAPARGLLRARSPRWNVWARLLNSLPPLAVLVVMLAGWKAAVVAFDVPPYLVPPPERVLDAFREDWRYLLEQLQHTAKMALLGFGLATLVGIAVAVLFSQAKIIERSLYPYLVLLHTTPLIAIAPLIVIWAGIGDRSVVIISFLISVFPIIVNGVIGLTSVDHNLVNLFRMSNASRWQEFLFLRLPYSVPYLFTGLRISSSAAVLGAILGEYLVGAGGVGGGMGYTIIIAAGQLKTARLFAAVLLCSLLALAFFFAVNTVANRLLRNWHESSAVHEN